MNYAYTVQCNDDGIYEIRIPDLPDAHGTCATASDIEKLATDTALLEMTHGYLAKGRTVPEAVTAGELRVKLPMIVPVKVLLNHLMFEFGYTRKQLGTELGMFPGTVDRLLELDRNTSLDTLANALRVFKHDLCLFVTDPENCLQRPDYRKFELPPSPVEDAPSCQ